MDTKSDTQHNEEVSKTHNPFDRYIDITRNKTCINLINIEIDPNVINLLNSSLTCCIL